MGMTFRRILVGLNQSFQDSLVFRRALEQAKPHTSELLIVHSLKPDRDMSIPAGYHSADALDMYATLQRAKQRRAESELNRSQDILSLYVENAQAKGIPSQIDCRIAQAEVRICELAEHWQADLIVLGHRDQGGVRQVGFESVTQYVIQRVGCSVLVVHGVEARQSIHEWDTVPDLRSQTDAVLVKGRAENSRLNDPVKSEPQFAMASNYEASLTYRTGQKMPPHNLTQYKTLMSRPDKGKRF
jgi:nucleotide-binding universal stress UspA family protein